jgi:hypothetical protein
MTSPCGTDMSRETNQDAPHRLLSMIGTKCPWRSFPIEVTRGATSTEVSERYRPPLELALVDDVQVSFNS